MSRVANITTYTDILTFYSTVKTGNCGGLCLAKMGGTRHAVI